MKKIKKNKAIAGIVAIILMIVLLILFFDKIKSIVPCVSAFGTLFLGCVSFWQTHQVKRRDDIYQKSNTKRPYLVISDVRFCDRVIGFEDNSYSIVDMTKKQHVVVELKNEGEGIAANLKFDKKDCFGDMCEELKIRKCISPGGTFQIKIPIEKAKEDFKSKIEFYYQNIVGFTYNQELHYETNPYVQNKNETVYSMKIYPISSQSELSNIIFADGEYTKI